MAASLLDTQPELAKKWASMNPLGRMGRPEELRGVIAWLASDVSELFAACEPKTVHQHFLYIGEHFLYRERVSSQIYRL